jgi:hypothetical protein
MYTQQQPKENKAAGLVAKIDQFIEDLATATDAARVSEQMTAYLDTCVKFYKYSEGNQFLIAWQRPDAEMVAGFNAWHKFNRFVKRGEKGIAILCPCPWAKEEKNAKGEPETKKGIYFKVGYVFDVSQTDGEPLPAAPTWQSPEQNPELFARLVQFAEGKGIAVTVKEQRGEIQGRSAGGKIEVSPTAGTKTVIHEIAHELLHHGDDRAQFTQEQRELQAEAVAYTVARAAGIEGLESPNYLALWGAEAKAIRANIAVIRVTSNLIISAITPEAQPAEEEEF